MDEGLDEIAPGGAVAGDGAAKPKAPRRTQKAMKGATTAFLDHLAATCNVGEAAAVAGIRIEALYRRRRRDPAFVAEWHAALLLGYEMLETLLVGHALAGGGERIETGTAIGGIDREMAFRLLTVHRNALVGKPVKGGLPRRAGSRQETDAAILKKLDALAKRRADALAAAKAQAAVDGRAVVEGRAAMDGDANSGGEGHGGGIDKGADA